MKIKAGQRARIATPILLLSAVTWMMLLANAGGVITVAHCPVTDSGISPASFQMLLAMNPPSSLTAGWVLMVIAMMSPTLIAPIQHITERSFKRRSVRSVTLFVIGYAAIWTAAGAVLLAATLLLNLIAPRSYLPALGFGIFALVWQCSPIKQRCLNRLHNHSELAAFGIAADLDALRFGITHGIWCFGSCWALMLLPMLLFEEHLIAMAVVTFVIVSERLEQPRPLIWRPRLRGKLMRILIAQTRIRLHDLRS